jgi:hypothetical protein
MCVPSESRDRAGNEKGVPQIEVTPEMIEAGYSFLLDGGAVDLTLADYEASVALVVSASSSRRAMTAGPRFSVDTDLRDAQSTHECSEKIPLVRLVEEHQRVLRAR